MDEEQKIAARIIFLLTEEDCRIKNRSLDTWIVGQMELEGNHYRVYKQERHRAKPRILYLGSDLLKALEWLDKEE